MTLSTVSSWIVSTRMIILSQTARAVLLERDGDSWSLPAVTTQGHWHGEVAPLVAAARSALGLSVTAVRCLRSSREANRVDALWLLQADYADAPGSAFRWAPLDDVQGVAPEDAALLTDGLVAGGGDRAPWLRPGWRREPLAWVRRHLDAAGFAPAGEPEQMRQWSITSIWRFPTSHGDIWFKAVPPMFAYEGKLIELIAPSMPGHLPRVIATDPSRGWTLMHALSSGSLRDRPQGRRDAIGREHDESLRVLARLQQAWVGREDELLTAGCPDRRLVTLDGAIEEILARGDVSARLTAEEAWRLREFGRDVPARVEALRACGVPETLMHGDFHAGNVAMGDGELVIFDWTDGCLSHPFFDLATFLPADPVERAALLDVYLGAWSVALPDAGVARAWEIAEPLACLHHAVSYARILAAVDPALRWEFGSDVMFWVRWLREIG